MSAVRPGFDRRFGERIAERARRSGIELSSDAIESLVAHATAVLARNAELHLTSIVDPEAWLERHLGESFDGAAMIAPSATGDLLDMGSGNGYPALPVAAAHPGLRPCLVEASQRKATFLREVIDASFPGGSVLGTTVQRADDLEDDLRFRVITSRAMSGWEKVLPRLWSRLEPQGDLLLWAGGHAETVTRRTAWSRFRLIERLALPGRDRSWVWRFRLTGEN